MGQLQVPEKTKILEKLNYYLRLNYKEKLEMIDFHTHTFLSDGELCPAELVQRAKEKGYRVLGITDHVDSANLDWVILRLIKFCQQINKVEDKIKVIPGIELTALPPSLIAPLAKEARKMGTKLILVHGEVIVEPPPPGTNEAALKADIDILAHPGNITEKEVKLAKIRGIYLEISARQGDCLTNGRVAMLARKYGAKLILGSDAHAPEDLIALNQAKKILQGAGLSSLEIEKVFKNAQELEEKITTNEKK